MSDTVAWLTNRGALVVTVRGREVIMTRSAGHVEPQLRKLGYVTCGQWRTVGDAAAIDVHPIR